MAPRKSATTEKKEEQVVEVQPKEEVIPTEKKYRYDFNDWDEYWSYKGPKG